MNNSSKRHIHFLNGNKPFFNLQRNPALGFLWWWIVGHLRPTTKNAALALPFSPEEVGRAIAEMKASSTPESDDLHVTFF